VEVRTGVGALGAEQKVGQVALTCFFLAIDLDPFAAWADISLPASNQANRAFGQEMGDLRVNALAVAR
jgi:hypothetical protein